MFKGLRIQKAIRATFWTIALATVNAPLHLAAQDALLQSRIKAAYLFNFAKFVDWPTQALPEATSPIIVGLLGKDVFEGELERSVSAKSINGRPLVIRRFPEGEDFRSCHILFISPSEKRRVPQILERLKGTSVLTVSEIEQFSALGSGGMITFFRQQNTIKFEINLDNAEKAGLKISSKLLQVAKVIRSEKTSRTDVYPRLALAAP